MPATDTALRNAKPGTRPIKISDGGGLFLLIQPNGARLWRLSYRHGGKQKTLALGPYPAVSLREARDRREAAKRLLRDGVDPSARRREEKAAQVAETEGTFRAIAAELVEKKKRAGRAASTLERFEWLLGVAMPFLGDRPVSGISAADILGVLRKVEARGKLESARRLRSVVGEVVRFAVATGRASGDPTPALRNAIAAPRVRSFGAILEPRAFGALLRAIDDYAGQYTVRAALQIAALTAPRPGELRHATWDEFDLKSGVWRIPAGHTKLRREHRIPLAPQAVAILRDVRELTGTGAGGLAFPGTRSVLRPMSDATLGAALRRLGYASGEVTAHGFRASFSTLANQSGLWRPDAIEKQLAHEEQNAVRRAYQRGDYWGERVRLMNWWADYLDELRDGGKVIALRSV